MELVDIYKIIQGILHDISLSPNGISTGDIVKKYGISRRVVPKYIGILEESGVPIYDERKRYFLDESYRVAFTLTPEESELLSLSLERSLIHYGANWRTIRSLIDKLSGKMPDAVGDLLVARLAVDHSDASADRWFTALAHAKRQQYEVWVDYHPLNRPEPTRWKVRPFRFFANPLSDGLYLLCEATQNDVNYIPLSLKFDRILTVQPTDQRFGVLELARFEENFGNAWGVWNTQSEPVRVSLRFEARHYDRLLESLWHYTQRISVENDDHVLFTVEVSDPHEMIPWIRSWGAGVEVLEPQALRQRVMRGLMRQIQMYGLAANMGEQVGEALQDYLWAKYNRSNHTFHRLIYHLLDVAAVAWMMWDRVLSVSQRKWISALLDVDENIARQQVAFLAGLHDIGKAVPSFQKKAAPLYENLKSLGIRDERTFNTPHGVHSAVILSRLLTHNGIDRFSARLIASAVGGHHGTWISDVTAQNTRGETGQGQWEHLQEELFYQLRGLFDLSALQFPQDETQLNLFAVFLSGFVSACDWIGSHEDFFPYESIAIPEAEYLTRSIAQAETALSELGWLRWHPPGELGTFEAMFQLTPNPLQRAAIEAFQAVQSAPRLILVEYLTGGGKTELALYLTDVLINLFGLGGSYVAMPTQATSNQMFERVSRYLQMRYPNQAINLQLAHAQSDFHPLLQQFQSQSGREGNESGITAEIWFQNRKRALLAPFAVGTVDQAMLSVLQAQHHFVRQYALSHKVIIFDEIHSYDTYMNTIIDRLLEWLTALQSPLILLSATLHEDGRRNLLMQVGAKTDAMPVVPYPRLTVVSHEGDVAVYALPQPLSRTLRLQHMAGDLQTLCEYVAAVYREGGCIAVICNTVDEAVAIARELRAYTGLEPDDVWLFHARFPAAWRRDIESRVLASFGKSGVRPMRTILVATQIIEQSLDLDFDLIITRIAPIDLLIQRAGRLHRHTRSRPNHLSHPTLIIRSPEFHADAPDFGVDEAVYARYILLKSWIPLVEKTELTLPDEIDAVINFVYNDMHHIEGAGNDFNHALLTAYENREMDVNRSTFRGKQHIIADPGKESLIGGFSEQLPDDENHDITTRDIRPGVDIICLSRTPGGLLPLRLNRRPTQDEINHFLQYRLTVRRKDWLEALKALPLNPYWERVASLRYAREIIFDGEEAQIPGSTYRLRLSKTYGLEFIEEEI